MSCSVSRVESLSVLLIDDDTQDADVVRECLRKGSQEVELLWERSLAAGLDVLCTAAVDVVVLDLGGSDSEGPERVERCAEVAPGTPVVGLVGPDEMEAAVAAEQAGATDCLSREDLSPPLASRTVRWAVERQRMHEEKSQRDAWVCSITESLAGAVYRSTPEGGIEYANAAFLDLFGYDSLEELRGTDPTALYAEPSDRARLAKLENEAGELDGVEVVFRRKDGSSFVGLLHSRVVPGEGGSPAYYDGTVADITERVRAERELEEMEAQYEALVEEVLYQSPIGIFVLDSNFDVAWMNDAIEEYFGLDREAVLGTDKRQLVETNIKDIVEEPEQFAKTVLGAYEDNSFVDRFECHVPGGPARQERWLQHWSRPIERGQYEGGRVEIYTDVTERKEVEQALRAERDRFETLFHNLPTPVVYGEADDEGRIRVRGVNETFEEVFGYDEHQIAGEDLQEVLLPDDPEEEDRAAALRHQVLTGEDVDEEVRREAAGGLRDFNLQVALRQHGEATEGYAIYTDITDRKQHARRLQETTQQLEAVIDASPVAIVALDLEGDVQLWNSAAERIFGWREDEVLGGPLPFVPDDEWEDYVANRQQVYEGAVLTGVEVERHAKDGRFLDLRLSAAPIRDSDGTVTGIMAALEDITEYKQRKRELRRTERRYQAVFEDPNILAAHLDTDGMVLDINQTALEYVDAAPEEVQGEPFWTTPWFEADEDTQNNVRGWIERAAAGDYVEFEIDHSDAVEGELVVSGVFRPVTDEEGAVESLLVSGRDVTGRRELDEQLRGRRRKIESLYQTTSHLLGAERPEEVAIRIEEVLRSTFDYLSNGVYFVRGETLAPAAVSPSVSQHLPEVPAPPLHGESLGARAVRSGRTIVADDLSELDTEHDHGDLKSAACVPIGEEGVIVVASAQLGGINSFDVKLVEILAAYASAVLDRIEHEDELRSAKVTAEQASELKTAMLANMSHEIRTPLTSVIGFSEVLKDRLDGELEDFAEKTLRCSRRLMKTLSSVLRLSRLEAGAYALDRKSVRLGEVVEETVEMLSPSAEEKSVSVRANLTNTPVEGHWNESAVMRITENLVENAIKFTPEGGTVEVRVSGDGGMGVLEVEDTGVGIGEEALPQIFEAFEQESTGPEREYGGTGLGLSIVRRLVEEHGGSIDVETQRGEGTCFTVRLPLSEGEPRKVARE